MSIYRNTRRQGVSGLQLLVCLLLMLASFSISATPRFVYSANYFGSSISIFRVETDTGMLRHLSHIRTVKSPSTVLLHPSGKFLYAVSQATDEIAIYQVNPVDGSLREIKDSPVISGVRSSFQLGVSPDGRLLFAPGRFTKNIMVFRIDQQTGALSALKENDFPTHGDRARFISVTPDSRLVYVSNTFDDNIAAYRVDTQKETLTPVEGMPFKAGDAPQASMMHPSGKFLYVSNWRGGNVSAYRIDPDSGVLTPIPGKAETGHWPFGGMVHPSGKYLYVVNYGTSDISGFHIDPQTGALSPIEGMPAKSDGTWPFNVTFDASGHHAYVPNYDSMDITVFDVDLVSGQLINPRQVYGRQGIRQLVMLEGDVPVELSAKWLITIDADQRQAVSYSVNSKTGDVKPAHTLPLKAVPSDLAIHPSGEWAFVGSAESKQIEILRIAADGRLTQHKAAISLKGTPRDLRVGQSGRFLYALTQSPNRYEVFGINAEMGELKREAPLRLPKEADLQKMLATPEERMAYVLDEGGDRIFSYRYLFSNGPLNYAMDGRGSPFEMERGLADMVIEPSGRYGLVLSSDKASLTSYTIPGRWGPLLKVKDTTISIGERPVAVTVHPRGRDVFVLDAGKPQIHLLQLDQRSGILRQSAPAVSLDAAPAELLIDPSGRFAYVRYASRKGLTRFEIEAATGRLGKPTELLKDSMPVALEFPVVIR